MSAATSDYCFITTLAPDTALHSIAKVLPNTMLLGSRRCKKKQMRHFRRQEAESLYSGQVENRPRRFGACPTMPSIRASALPKANIRYEQPNTASFIL